MHAIFACEESQNAQIYKWFWGTWFRSKFAKKKRLLRKECYVKLSSGNGGEFLGEYIIAQRYVMT